MEAFYKDLFDYNYQMNQKLISAFDEHSDKIPEKSVKWINHILNAHHLWNNRIDKQDEPYGVWQVHSLGHLKDMDLYNFERTSAIITKGEFDKTINYVNTVGNRFSNSLKEILTHVVNHSTYHRGQIAADFKEAGVTPLVTDYIAFKR